MSLSFLSSPCELRLGPPRSLPPHHTNVEAGSSRRAQRDPYIDLESADQEHTEANCNPFGSEITSSHSLGSGWSKSSIQLRIFLPMFQMDESEQCQEPSRSLPPARTNVEAVRSRRRQMTPVTDVDSVEISLRNQRRRVSPLIPYVNFEGTSSSMLHVEPVAPQLPPPVAPPSSPPPPPVASQPSPPQPSLLAPICPICWGPMVEETSTKCGHVFCGVCIRSALSAQAKCPICRCWNTHRGLRRIFFPAPS